MTAPATIANRYALIRLLGQGGMGAVHEAEHLVTHRRVAIKLLHRDQAWTSSMVARFLREAQIAAAIGHPNIIDVLDAGVDEGVPFLVFEYLQGTSVGALVEAGPLPIDRALAITAEVLDALVAAHARGVLHRDIKPDNVFLATSARGDTAIKLLDFGIARAVSDLGLTPNQATQTGTIMGTPAYMSPEQVRGLSDIDARADVWSVGVMLYEMLSGALPFQAANPNALLFTIATEPMVPLASVAPGLPASLVSLVERALTKDRADRTPSSAEMLSQLQQIRVELGLMGRASVVPAIPPSLATDGGVDVGMMPTLSSPSTTPEKSTLEPHETFPPRRHVMRRSASVVLALVLLGVVIGTLVYRPARSSNLPPSQAVVSGPPRAEPTIQPTPAIANDAGLAEDTTASVLLPASEASPRRAHRGSHPRLVRPTTPITSPPHDPPPLAPHTRARIRPVTGFDGI